MVKFCLSLLCFLFLWSGNVLQAQEKPLWEAGIGVSGLYMPDYIGSNESNSYAFPIPYLIYRGDIWKVDRSGVRGDFIKGNRYRLGISMNAGVPVKSDDNEARAGMPDLDPTFEVGPALRILLGDTRHKNYQWELRIPVRTVMATDFSSSEAIGWVLSPALNFETDNGAYDAWNMGFTLGPLFSTEAFHDYYYQVKPQYQTSERPLYDAHGGYSGSRLGLTLSKRFPHYWVGAFARYDNISGAVFEDSPLVRRKHSFLIGAGISWIFAKSDTLVQLDE